MESKMRFFLWLKLHPKKGIMEGKMCCFLWLKLHPYLTTKKIRRFILRPTSRQAQMVVATQMKKRVPWGILTYKLGCV